MDCRLLLIVGSMLASSLCFSQVPVFYCNKGGVKSITDRPCETFGAIEERKLEGRSRQVAKPDSVALSVVCPMFQRQKQQILDDQYYRGVPASAKSLNSIDATIASYGCPKI